MVQVEVTRREQLRVQMVSDIKQHALAQLAEGGPEALSLNAIARAMRVSGPALYRYFASREDLLGELAADGYDSLGEALEAAADGADVRDDGVRGARLRAVAAAYRGWVLAHPHLYRLMFASRYGSGLVAPDRVVPASRRPMIPVLTAVAELGGPTSGRSLPDALVAQLKDWQSRSWSSTAPPETALLAVTAWTRLHGLLGLEIEGVFVSMGVDAGALVDAEMDQIIASTSA
ncbi:TetR/AcrR family transcriptional regulator [Auraticoccus monumenti]|uniref:DNA-binding transcriptional regulator, AcrR family n=1 Tax=Auraticoccus monumenti TaxID=675864 RepID=A0A1G6UZ82_9ACTN|nr:TetR/AcrR family transcriptional regulator [Auraticoccus monumenti]SDD46632.1 DNA-binding transcriptional regulator, AcrR family [Auraticoccus monumenti]